MSRSSTASPFAEMPRLQLLLVFLPLLFSTGIAHRPILKLCSPSDQLSLLKFKSGVSDNTTKALSTWTPTRDCCTQWKGVRCNLTTGAVTSLKLHCSRGHNLLQGTLSLSLGFLPSLQVLELVGCKRLNGTIPRSLQRLTQLHQLVLDDNNLGGELPSLLHRLSSLKNLSLSHNRLTGEIPRSLGLLLALQSLDLSHNNLSGLIPGSIANLPALQKLDLSGNALTGNLPISFQKGLRALNSIDLSYNNLTLPTIPRWFLRRKNLTKINLAGLNLTGNLPEFPPNSTLRSLNVSNNEIRGEIPRNISNLQELVELDLSKNRIIGRIPSSLRVVEGLQVLDVSYNRLVGSIPRRFEGLKNLARVNFKNNKLCGRIPQGEFFSKRSARVYANNLCLCGLPLKPCNRDIPI